MCETGGGDARTYTGQHGSRRRQRVRHTREWAGSAKSELGLAAFRVEVSLGVTALDAALVMGRRSGRAAMGAQSWTS